MLSAVSGACEEPFLKEGIFSFHEDIAHYISVL